MTDQLELTPRTAAHQDYLKKRRSSFAQAIPWNPPSKPKTPPPTPPEGSNEQLSHIRIVFDLFDADGTGVVDADELYSLFHALGDGVTFEEMESILHEFDRDNSGGIDYEARPSPPPPRP